MGQYNGTIESVDEINATLSSEQGIDAEIQTTGTIEGEILTSRTYPVPANIKDLGDTNISNPQNDDILKYDASSNKWVNGVTPTTDEYIQSVSSDFNVVGSQLNLSSGVSSTLAKVDTDESVSSAISSAVENKITIPSSANENQVLTYDGTDWIAADSQGGGGATYTAGDGISIENDTISTETRIVDVTQTEYDALTDEQKNDETVFWNITDAESDIEWSYITGTPNTLNGYGITDAYTKSEVDDLLNDQKVNVIDNLTSTSTEDALSANQGRVLNNSITSVSNIEKNIIGGDAWVSGTSYSVNNTCIYNNKIYVCLKAHTSSASILPTNNTYWKETSISKLNSEIMVIDSGFVSMSIAEGDQSSDWITVSFSKTFTATPMIVATCYSGTSVISNVSVATITSASKTGFQIKAWRNATTSSGGASPSFYWIAIGR